MSELLTIALAILLGFQSGWLVSTKFHRRLRSIGSGNDRDDE